MPEQNPKPIDPIVAAAQRRAKEMLLSIFDLEFAKLSVEVAASTGDFVEGVRNQKREAEVNGEDAKADILDAEVMKVTEAAKTLALPAHTPAGTPKKRGRPRKIVAEPTIVTTPSVNGVNGTHSFRG